MPMPQVDVVKQHFSDQLKDKEKDICYEAKATAIAAENLEGEDDVMVKNDLCAKVASSAMKAEIKEVVSEEEVIQIAEKLEVLYTGTIPKVKKENSTKVSKPLKDETKTTKEKVESTKLARKEETEEGSSSASDTDEEDDADGWISPKERVFEFIISLDYTSPRIWRKIQVLSTFTFEELHTTIQSSMGWRSSHQHQFRVFNTKTDDVDSIGSKLYVPDFPEFDFPKILYGGEIGDYFTEENKKAQYIYDFGDDWIHTIFLDKILPIEDKGVYPKCISGELACPPEDVGGIDGFYSFVKIIKNPAHPDYEDMKQWIEDDGGYPNYDPDRFNLKHVMFQYVYVMNK